MLLGYLAGNSYATIEKTFGRAAALSVAALVVIGLIVWRIRRHRHQRAIDAGRDTNQSEPGDEPHG